MVSGEWQPNWATPTRSCPSWPHWHEHERQYVVRTFTSSNSWYKYFTNVPRYSTQSYTRAHHHTTVPAEALTTMVTNDVIPLSSLGKRCQKRYETYGCGLLQADDQNSEGNGLGPQKRARTIAIGVPVGVKSAKKTPATRTQQDTTSNPRQQGAERGGSRPRQRREFTIDPCRDLVSSEGR